MKTHRGAWTSPFSQPRRIQNRKASCMAKILLLGLENDLAVPLARVLRNLEHDVETAESLESGMRHRTAELIFANGDDPDFRYTLRTLSALRPDLPAVVVNRLPDNMRWLDALDAGAADYCGAPFEPTQVRWVIDSALRRCAVAVAA